MAAEGENKEVNYKKYCPKCKNLETSEVEDPCNECLETFTNVNSEKPVNFKDKNE